MRNQNAFEQTKNHPARLLAFGFCMNAYLENKLKFYHWSELENCECFSQRPTHLLSKRHIWPSKLCAKMCGKITTFWPTLQWILTNEILTIFKHFIELSSWSFKVKVEAKLSNQISIQWKKLREFVYYIIH